MRSAYDVVVVGAGPNGLAAAITCARAGCDVLLVEGESTVGGGARSAELTLPGFTHDPCSAIHPLGRASPFFARVPLEAHGLEWVDPEVPLAHPLGGGAALLERSLDATAERLGPDGPRYARLFAPLVEQAAALYGDALAPLRVPRHPLLFARFGRHAVRSARSLAERAFAHDAARALFAGCGAHSFLPLEARFSAAFGLVLSAAGHAFGWPCARGGSGRIAGAMAGYLRALGGSVVTGWRVESIRELPTARAYLFDVFPHALARIADGRLPAAYTAALARYRHAPGVFKVDWALASPIPWAAREVGRAGTVHLGGTLDEVSAAEAAVARGEVAASPFVLLAQPSVMDPTRAPAGKHTAWAYCHVPWNSSFDMTGAIEAQVERFAPGFRECVLARHTRAAADYGQTNPNMEGGDIAGGAVDGWQLFARPVARAVPYATPARDIFLCSSATPPGGGVHGMCGYWAARVALRRVFGMRTFIEGNAE